MPRKLFKEGYELCDVNIVQSKYSTVEHRKDCDTYIKMCGRKVHPVIVAPMASVTDAENYRTWLDNGFICVVPRSVDFEDRLRICTETFCSFSLDEAEKLSIEKLFSGNEKIYVCIDVAHGTMARLYTVCKNLRRVFESRIEIMTGNVANPEAYDVYADYGIDYMRLSVGSGSCCVTAANVGIHFPVATLIDEIMQRKAVWESNHGKSQTKVIVDGGISNFDDIQKCLALGAFAVMNGSFFAKSEEACGEVKYFLKEDISDWEKGITHEEYQELQKRCVWYPRKPYREYYGMSTKRAQKQTVGVSNKTSEGIVRMVEVEYPIAKWADNMKSYIASAMSYTGCYTLDEFREEAEVIINLSGDKSFRK